MEILDGEKPLEPDSDPPETLLQQRKTLAPDLVWAKINKGQPWWPSRVLANSDDGRIHVCRFGDGQVGTTSSCHVSQVKPFFNPDVADMARQTLSKTFHSSFMEAIGFATKYLQSELTCNCVPLDAKPFRDPQRELQIGVCNLTTLEFVNHMRDAAVSVSAVNLEECVRLKSWVFATGQGLCNGEVRFNQRKLIGELVDVFDLDLDACAKDDDLEDNLMISGISRGCKSRKKKRESKNEKGLEGASSGAGVGASGKRERKKSRYLSPPYTFVVAPAVQNQSEEKLDEEQKIKDRDGEGADFEVFSVCGIFNDLLLTATNPLHLKWKRSAKVFRVFFEKYRGCVFVQGREHESYVNLTMGSDVTRVEEEFESVKGNEEPGSGAHHPKKWGRKRKDDKYLISSGSITTMPNAEKSKQKKETKDLTMGADVTRVDEEFESVKGKKEPHSGVHQPKKRGRKRKEDKYLISLGSVMPNVAKAKAKQKEERKDLTMGSDFTRVDEEFESVKEKGKPESGAHQPKKRGRKRKEEKYLISPGSGTLTVEKSEQKEERKDLTMRSDVTRVDKEFESIKRKDKPDSGARQPKKRGRKRKEGKHLTNPGSGTTTVEKSERKELTGSGSSVPSEVNINFSGTTMLNFARGSYEFLEEARAQMLKTCYVKNGNKPVGIGDKSQEQWPLKKCKKGNSDGTVTGTGDKVPQKRGRKKKVAQVHYPNPAVLLFDFSKPNAENGTGEGTGTNLPSRDVLLSTFGKFGLLVETESHVHRDAHTAKVVFARSADAEAAYNSSDEMGLFGPPFASCRLHYLPPIIVNPTSPAQQTTPHQVPAQQPSPKPQLSDIKKNLEKMISSLTSGPGLAVKKEPGTVSALDGIRPELRGSLVGEMQGLLMKVEKRLSTGGGATSSAVPVVPPP